jgi:hypothetical protein
MQQMNCIHLSRPDYRAISGSDMIPTRAPGAVVYNPHEAGEKFKSEAVFFWKN